MCLEMKEENVPLYFNGKMEFEPKYKISAIGTKKFGDDLCGYYRDYKYVVLNVDDFGIELKVERAKQKMAIINYTPPEVEIGIHFTRDSQYYHNTYIVYGTNCILGESEEIVANDRFWILSLKGIRQLIGDFRYDRFYEKFGVEKSVYSDRYLEIKTIAKNYCRK